MLRSVLQMTKRDLTTHVIAEITALLDEQRGTLKKRLLAEEVVEYCRRDRRIRELLLLLELQMTRSE